MGYEIDFLPVGEESNGGDAIALRYGNLFGLREEQTVIVIDGGYKDCGEALVSHLANYYGTDVVDVVVSTHPDQDHASGLSVILEQCRVGQLWMHLPWRHSGEMAALSKQAFRSEKLNERVEASLRSAQTLEELANDFNIPIVEPFTGVATADGSFRILGPTVAYYEELQRSIATGQSTTDRFARVVADALEKAAQKLLSESLYNETLTDSGETSPRNNTSAIGLLRVDGRAALFTGDAGIPALEAARTELLALGIVAGDLNFVQVPHHGSRRNVGPTLLDALFGGVVDTTRGTAFVSAPKKNPEHKHPSKKVMNAFRRRGYPVHATQGVTKWHHHGAPARSGFSTSEPLPLYDQVEADGDDG